MRKGFPQKQEDLILHPQHTSRKPAVIVSVWDPSPGIDRAGRPLSGRLDGQPKNQEV